MNRPKEFDRDDAVVSLMDEVWRHGYESCSVNSMSEALGITRSSFYNAFRSREDLFIEILALYRESGRQQDIFSITESKSVLSSISEKLYEICESFAEDKECRGCLAVSSIQEIVKKNTRLEPVLKAFFNENVGYFEKVIAIAIERGELEDCDIRIKAMSLQNLLMGLSEMSKIFHKKDELWALCEHSLKALSLYGEFG
jgi:TetR/AcrR family transcriptional regulator, transcriptional repressor for nem operon